MASRKKAESTKVQGQNTQCSMTHCGLCTAHHRLGLQTSLGLRGSTAPTAQPRPPHGCTGNKVNVSASLKRFLAIRLPSCFMPDGNLRHQSCRWHTQGASFPWPFMAAHSILECQVLVLTALVEKQHLLSPVRKNMP